MRKPKPPQEKKRLSYAKDRRNDYGENSKSSRKSIPRNRAIANRKYRRQLQRDLTEQDFGLVVPAAAAMARKAGWRKSPDTPLGDYLKRRRARRAAHKKHERLQT
jgi:hypothetical protein